ncbi:MAG: Shedu anti-phage system protein SduA domain-containing protein [Blastocatellia bacterium]
MSRKIPDVAFLGVCERATLVKGDDPQIWEHNLLGLKEVVLFRVYPFILSSFHFAFAVYDPFGFGEARVRIIGPDGIEVIFIDIQFKRAGIESGINVFAQAEYPVWTVIVVSGPKQSPLIKEPGQYKVVLRRGDEEIPIGCLVFGYVQAIPLTADRIAAIKSDPYASKWVRYSMKCNGCNKELRTYTGLERSERAERDGWGWYKSLPDTFHCDCGKNNFSLKYIREGLHAFLGGDIKKNAEISFARLYEKRAFENTCRRFKELLDKEPLEEEVQQFIEKNPVLLHQFSPERIFYKAPVLTKYNTDIIVLTHKKELLLIELERPSTRLLKKGGHLTSELEHPFDQIRDWLLIFEEHRLAALDCIGLKTDEVGMIRGIAILGRDQPYNPDHLRRLKSQDFGKISIFTYDDLLNGLVTLSCTIDEL